MTVTLICPVRGCAQPLEPFGGAPFGGEPDGKPLGPQSVPVIPSAARDLGAPIAARARLWRCADGHTFDVARSGYVNLTQPQDRRSATPGDRQEAAAARRRLYEAGHGAPLVDAIGALLEACKLPAQPAVLDVCCGEGSLLGDLAGRRSLEAHGLDLSVAALDMAARRFPGICWVGANADRLLPYADRSFDVVLVLSARLNPAELRRVVAPTGCLLVATPAPDDLVELRDALLGEPLERDRMARSMALLAPVFALTARTTVRQHVSLDAAAVHDVLTATYRGGRRSQQARLASLGAQSVTMSHDLAVCRPVG